MSSFYADGAWSGKPEADMVLSMLWLPDPLTLILLVLSAVAAGLMDAIAGGGGLITVPALLASGLPPGTALATNKLQGCFGSGTALVRYAQAGLVTREEVLPAVGFTALGAVAGTVVVRYLPSAWLNWLIPALLTAIFLFLLIRRDWGKEARPARWNRLPFYLVFGLALGFYDGFLGPGTGTFWTIALTALLGHGLVSATAQTKVANFTSNLVSLVVFAVLGQVLWALGLLMGLGQAVGARMGAKLAMTKGTGFIRIVFLIVVAATLAKVLWTALT
jgi:uncharacterized membrane protein YfcA